MSPLVIFPYYIVWHYTRAIGDLFVIFGNLIWFMYYYFSINTLLKTLFKPIRSLKQFSENNFKQRGWFLNFVIETGLAGFGFTIRMFIIGAGIISIIVTFFVGLMSLFLWLVIPPMIIFLMVTGLIGIFKV